MAKRKLCDADDDRVDLFLPLFCRDFLMSTIGWTATQRGHYLTLLMVQWDAGSLPQELEFLERISGGISGDWKLLEDKFPVDKDGLRRNKRLEEHRKTAVELRQKRRENGKKGGQAKGKPGLSPASLEPKPGLSPALAQPKHPEPEPEPQILSLTRENPTAAAGSPPDGGKEQRQPGYAMPVWESLLGQWNQAAARTKHISRYDSLHPPRAFHDRYDEIGWQDDWQRGIQRLERCKWFTTPVSLTFFLKQDTLAAILAGQFDPKKPAKPGEAQSQGPVVSTRMWRDDACQNMTDEQYAAWRRQNRTPALAAAAKTTKEEDL
jgi:uncharacterized protein YdaU (DUF1376 family)